MKNILVLVFCCSWNVLQAQEQDSQKFMLSVQSGLSIPSGPFAKSNIENSLYFSAENPERWISGINKSKSGFAEPGYFISLEMLYKIRPAFGVLLRTGYSTNPVDTETISNFLISFFDGREQKFVEDD